MNNVSLKVKNGAPKKVLCGTVEVDGNCVCLYALPADEESYLVYSYCLSPGETVRLEGEGEYVVD